MKIMIKIESTELGSPGNISGASSHSSFQQLMRGSFAHFPDEETEAREAKLTCGSLSERESSSLGCLAAGILTALKDFGQVAYLILRVLIYQVMTRIPLTV